MSSTSIWKIDPGHSQIRFKVKHLSITNVNGIFKTFEGAVACPEEGFDDPQIVFEGALRKNGETYALEGTLTIRDVTRPIKLDTEFTGAGIGFAGDQRAGFEARGRLSRKDYGLSWNIAAEGGGLVIGDEINLHLDIELVKIE